MNKIKTGCKNKGTKKDPSPLRIFDESMVQMSKASLMNDSNLQEQSFYTTYQNEMEAQPLYLKQQYSRNNDCSAVE